ncbi:MAG: glutathione S-transferase, partial [bacterium]
PRGLAAELAGSRHRAGDYYSMADHVAQCDCVLGKFTGLRIPPELTYLSRWFSEVTARPSARA